MATMSSKAINAASAPDVRARAVATSKRNGKLRDKLAAQYNEPASAFQPKNIAATIKRRDIPIADLPPGLLKPLGKKTIAKMVNGHGGGVGIPLDAIPDRKAVKKANGAASPHYGAKRGHPNAELIAKTIDLIGKPDINDKVAERLLAVLDKLVA